MSKIRMHVITRVIQSRILTLNQACVNEGILERGQKEVFLIKIGLKMLECQVPRAPLYSPTGPL